MTAGLPLTVRRRALRLAWLYGGLRGRAQTLGLSSTFRQTLRMPIAEAKRLDREALFIDRLYSLEWLSLLVRTPHQVASDWRSVAIPDRAVIERVAATGKPVILAPIHMGCFALPFARLIHDIFRGRPMLILRAREDREIETRVMRRVSEMGTPMRFLNVSRKQDYFDAVRFARSGSIIVSFVDLPASYGGAVDTTLFGRPARLAMGLDSLARLTEAAVIPLAITSSLSGDTLHASRPFEVSESGPASRRRVTDIVRRHIERSVLAAPHQWFMWQRLNEFLPEAADPGDAA